MGGDLMPTYTHGDSRFDPIEFEYSIKEYELYGKIRTEVRIVIKDCLGADHPTPRVFNSLVSAMETMPDEMEFQVKFWGEQLDNRDRAIVADGTHFRIGDAK